MAFVSTSADKILKNHNPWIMTVRIFWKRLLTNLLKLEAGRNAIFRNVNRESSESKKALLPSLKQLTVSLDEELVNTLLKVLHELFDGPQIQRNDAPLCKLHFSGSAYCSRYL